MLRLPGPCLSVACIFFPQHSVHQMGNQRVQLEDHLLVPDLIWGPPSCLMELQGNGIDFLVRNS